MRTTEMTTEVQKDEQPQQINSKPNFPTRAVGGLIDILLVFILFIAFQSMIMATPMRDSYNHFRNQVIEVQDEYKLSTDYGHKVYEGEQDYSKYEQYLHHEDEQGIYVVVNNTNLTEETIKKYTEALKGDNRYNAALFNYKLIDYGFTMFEVGIAEIILLLIIPLVNKRRATIGKFAANSALFYPRRETYAKWWQILLRFFFSLIVETAFPALFLNSVFVMLIVIAINLIVMLISKNTFRTIRDYISTTMVIDNSTYKALIDQFYDMEKKADEAK